MEPPREMQYTIDDIDSLPGGVRAELIDGRIYYMASPTFTHQNILGWLYVEITNYIRSKGNSCKVVMAPFAVFLNKDTVNYVEPDISVICDVSKLDDKGCHGAPDWILEISSPSTHRMDMGIKLFKYRTAGVREYWVVDTDNKEIFVWNFENDDNFVKYSFADIVPAGIYHDYSINFSTLNP